MKIVDIIKRKKRKVENNVFKNHADTQYHALTPESDIQNGQEYMAALDWALEQEDIRNIAISGPYGSGKSSVINTYFKTRENNTVCAISLYVDAVLVDSSEIREKYELHPEILDKAEAVGVPMGIMGNAMVNHPEKLPDDVHSFLTDIAPQKEWEKEYIPGEWDSCKWSFSDGSLFQNDSLRHILSLTYKTILACPGDAYQSFRLNTRIVWEPFVTDLSWIPDWYIAENSIGIEKRPIIRGET